MRNREFQYGLVIGLCLVGIFIGLAIYRSRGPAPQPTRTSQTTTPPGETETDNKTPKTKSTPESEKENKSETKKTEDPTPPSSETSKQEETPTASPEEDGVLRGRVTDPTGPVADAVVTVLPMPKRTPELKKALESNDPNARREAEVTLTNSTSGSARTASTNENGEYRVEGLTPDGRYEVRVTGTSRHQQKKTIITLTSSPYTLDIRLERAAALTGTITGPDGPIKEARVQIQRPVQSQKRRTGIGFGVSQAGPSAVTDAKGRYELGGVKPGEVTLLVLAPRHKNASRTITLIEDAVQTEDFVLDRGARIAGRVVDDSDRPLSGIELAAHQRPSGQSVVLPEKATSGPDGRFELIGFEEDTSVSLSARDPEQNHTVKHPEGLYNIAVGTRNLTIRMTAAGRIDIRVETEQGEPVAGAQVAAQSRNGRFWRSQNQSATDQNGKATLQGLTPGPYRVQVQAKSYAKTSKDVDVEAGQTKQLTVQVTTGGILTGHVKDASGTPVEGAVVLLVDREMAMGGMNAEMMAEMQARNLLRFEGPAMSFAGLGALRNVKTDENGEYNLEGMPPGEQTVLAVARGKSTARKTVRFQKDETRRADFTVEGGATIRGTVLEADGQPIKDATVMVYTGMSSMRNTQTDEKGAFEVAGLTAGVHNVMVQAQSQKNKKNGGGAVAFNFRTLNKQVKLEEGKTETLTLQFSTGTTVTGRVLKGNEPQANIMVQLYQPEKGFGDMRMGQTDEDGRYEIEDVLPGTYEAMLRGNGITTRLPVNVPDAPRVEHDFRIPVSMIAGRLTSAETGKPLAGGQVTVWKASSEKAARGLWTDFVAQTTADNEGRFSLEGISGGRYRLRFQAPAHALDSMLLDLPEAGTVDGIERRLKQGTTLEGQVRDPKGNPAQAQIALRERETGDIDYMSWGQGQNMTDDEGRFELKHIRPGTYTVYAFAQGFAPARAQVRIPVGGTRIDLSLNPEGTLALTVVDGAGNPVSDVRVTLRFPDGGTVGEVPSPIGGWFANGLLTGEAGLLEQSGLIPGTYTLVLKKGEAVTERTVTVKANETTEVQIRLTAASQGF